MSEQKRLNQEQTSEHIEEQGYPLVQGYLLADSTQTAVLGSAIALQLAKFKRQPWRVYLRGDLGAGKTTLARALLQGLGVQGRIKSPTFALMEPYAIDGHSIIHFDFYRMNDPLEWLEAGFAELFESAWLTVSEWPEMAGSILPSADIDITLSISADTLSRHAQITASTQAGAQIISQLEYSSGSSLKQIVQAPIEFK